MGAAPLLPMPSCGFTLAQNVIVKASVPPVGVVSSNPERTQRLVAQCLQQPTVAVQSWGVTVVTGTMQGRDLFFASVPMGASGSAHAFHELFAAGARAVVRLGSNDGWVRPEDMGGVVLVSEARGLRGLSWDHGIDPAAVDTPLHPDPNLMDQLRACCQAQSLTYTERVCFNVDDYHAYLYPDLAPQPERIRQRLAQYDAVGPHCRDMETAALFLKAQQFGVRAASVLQNVVKQKAEAPYAGDTGARAKMQEVLIARLIVAALLTMAVD